MLTIEIHKVVEQLVEQFLVESRGRNGEAMYFHFDLRMSYIAANLNVSRRLHLLYHLRSGSTYVDAFSAVTESPFASLKEVFWNHEASHDSCWRDIKVYNHVYFEMAEEINQLLKTQNKKKIAPIKMFQWHGFGFSRTLFCWVPVAVTRPDPNNSYTKAIQVI